MSTRLKVRAVGSAFSAMSLGGTIATTIGACLAYVQKAPVWAFFLFFGAFMVNIPVGGIIGFIFHGGGNGKTSQE
jgi:hypothetical protein